MKFNVIFILRIIQAVLAIIILGLTAYFVSEVDKASGGWGVSPGEVNFNLFNGIWTAFLVVPYLALAPIYFEVAAHPIVMAAVEALTCLFWFAGFIALAALIGRFPASWCSSVRGCAEMQATTVFGAFEFVLFAATIALTIVIPKIKGRKTTNAEPNPEV